MMILIFAKVPSFIFLISRVLPKARRERDVEMKGTVKEGKEREKKGLTSVVSSFVFAEAKGENQKHEERRLKNGLIYFMSVPTLCSFLLMNLKTKYYKDDTGRGPTKAQK